MIAVVEYDQYGRIITASYNLTLDKVYQDPDSNYIELDIPEGINLSNYKINLVTNTLEEYSLIGLQTRKQRSNGIYFIWDAQNEQWIDNRPLEIIKLELLEQIKTIRDQKINSTFLWNNLEFDSDPVSQNRILGLYTASISTPSIFPISWRLANNSWHSIEVADAASVWNSLQQHISSNFEKFKQHEISIGNILTVEDAKQYDINQYW